MRRTPRSALVLCSLISCSGACSRDGPGPSESSPSAASPRLALLSAFPSHVHALDGSAPTLSLSGRGFSSGATVSVNGESVRVLSVSPSEVRVVLDLPQQIRRLGPASIAIRNLDGGTILRSDLLHFGASELGFEAPGFVRLGAPISRLTAIDVDGDGKDDLAMSGPTVTGATQISRRSGATYLPAASIEEGWFVPSAVLDLDGDGLADMAGSSVDTAVPSSVFRVAWSTGNGRFDYSSECAQPASPVLPGSAADLDGDGKADLLVFKEGSIAVCMGRGARSFSAPISYPFALQPSAVSIVDLDGDGRSEVAIADGAINQIAVLRLNPTAGLQQVAAHPLSSKPVRMVASDLDCDGRPDLAFVDDAETPRVGLLMGRGEKDGAPQLEAARVDLPFFPQEILLSDRNGDRRLDLVLTESNGKRLSILLNRPERCGTFAAPTYYASDSTRALLALDFNSDGQSDLAVGAAGSDVLTLFAARRDGTLVAPPHLSRSAVPVVTDADGDGRLDLIYIREVLNATYQILVQIHLQRQPGVFTAEPVFSLSESRHAPTPPLVLESQRPGELTLIVATDSPDGMSHSLTVLRSDRNGAFAIASPLILPSGARAVAAGDVDGDGIVDLAAAVTAGVAIFRGNGKGGFQSPYQLVPTNGAANGIALYDHDGDHRQDLAVVNYVFKQDGNIQLLRSLDRDPAGRLSFAVVGQAALPCEGESDKSAALQPIDMDRDGQIDLVVKHKECLFILPHSGTIRLGTPRLIPLPAEVSVISQRPAGDLDSDGIPDLVMDRSNAGSVALLGDGVLGFTSVKLPQTWRPAVFQLVADLDGDGLQDIVTDRGVVFNRSR